MGMKRLPFSIKFLILVLCAICFLSFTAVTNADSYKTSLKKAIELDSDGFFEEAIAYWEKSRIDSPSNIKLFSGLKISGIYGKLGKLNRSVEVSRALTKSHPKQYESWFSYANASGAVKNYTQAVSAFKKSVALKPSEGLIKVGLAFALFGDKKPNLAISHLKDAMKIFKTNKNISWYRDCRLAIRQIKDFARFPPKFAHLWLEKNLKRVQDTFENSVLDFESLLKAP